MSRGPGGRTADIASARRKGSRRAAEARVRQEQRKRLRAGERKHARRFLRVAARVARRRVRDFGGRVRIERLGGATGLRGLLRWKEAVVQLAPVDVSVRFTLADKRGSGSSNAIRVYAGRKLVRPCPEELLQSGGRRAFAAWLDDALGMAVDRAPSGGGR